MTHHPAPYKIYSLPIPIPGHEAVSYLYLVRSTRSALIDTGPASTLPLVMAALAQFNIHPSEIDFILGTHIHLDHLGGLSQALKLMPRAKVIVHPRGLPHLVDPTRLWKASLAISGQIALDYGQPEAVLPERLSAAADGQTIDLGETSLEVLFTPGHAPHHISFFERENKNLFAGEGAGISFGDASGRDFEGASGGVIRPAAPPPFDPRQSMASLEKMAALQPDTIYYCHYGYSRQAMIRLKVFRQGLTLWTETVESFFKPATELTEDLVEQIVETIITRDGTKKQFGSYSAERLKSEMYFLRNNVRGFWDYFRRNPHSTLKA